MGITSNNWVLKTIISLLHQWIFVPIVVNRFQAIIGKSNEQLLISFPLIKKQFYLGGLTQALVTTSKDLVEVIVHDPINLCWKMLILQKMNGLDEGYVTGDFDCKPGLKELITLMIRSKQDNYKIQNKFDGSKNSDKVSQLWLLINFYLSNFIEATKNYFQQKLQSNAFIQSKLYLSSTNTDKPDRKLLELFLDESMTYSSAIFEDPFPINDVKTNMQFLYEAQLRKYDALFDLLKLKATDNVLEIGSSGYSFGAVRAVQKFGCRWFGLADNKETLEFSQKQIKAAELENMIDVKLLDLFSQDLGTYDKIICIEAMELFQKPDLDLFLSYILNRLNPGGIAVFQVVVNRDHRYRVSNINGYLPSISDITSTLPKGLTMDYNFPKLSSHYSKTLSLWNDAWSENVQKVQALDNSGVLFRKQQLEFASRIADFENGNLDVVQLAFTTTEAAPVLPKPNSKFSKLVNRFKVPFKRSQSEIGALNVLETVENGAIKTAENFVEEELGAGASGLVKALEDSIEQEVKKIN